MDDQRLVISDGLWQPIAPLLPGNVTDAGMTVGGNRLLLEDLGRRVDKGSPWVVSRSWWKLKRA